MRTQALGLLARVAAGILFPLVLGASGCCGCPMGLCSSLMKGLPGPGSSPPTTGPSLGVGGGAGASEAEAEAGEPSAPLAPEGAQAERQPVHGSAKEPSLSLDSRLPIRGALQKQASGKTRFVPHAATAAAPIGDGSSFVVAGATGLWQHDTNTLAKRSRLVPGPVLDVAAAPDGARFAYTLSGGRVRVVEYPSLKQRTAATVDVPVRMRFSADGKHVAFGSESDTVTLLDVATGKTHVFDTDEDVNDVFPLPDRPGEVAYASDDDEFAIVDVLKGRKVFGSEPLVERWRSTNRPFFTMRDQQAVAYDPVTKTLIGGGDDNMLWRVDDLRGAPSIRAPIELGGNVVEIACCAGLTAVDRAAYVAVDDLRVRAVALDGRLGPQFGPLMGSVGSFKIRIALLPSGDVLVVPQGTLYRWGPRTGEALRSSDYAAPSTLSGSALDADTVYVLCDTGVCVVHRVAHGAPAADVETVILGELPGLGMRAMLPFDNGTRAIVTSKDNKLRLVYLGPGGALEAPIDTPADASFGEKYARRDGGTHGCMLPGGDVYEITASPRGARKVGTAAGSGPVSSFDWDAASKRWRIGRRGHGFEYVP
ncbi:WD40 repeat domain-containing protein [Polyangium sorediatum]|uniref:WD40 repeat domain-containing protein n=1 Tax=Polyangium sorediatum TaxID=889274 RepID=A0ABT6NLM0_9BACT|nr:WD40 repeat domain-containing protein [Polyangium sorediatum]MDI1429217.1 WD40 repeat domain-containing protein [Polyangium sorediatum]